MASVNGKEEKRGRINVAATESHSDVGLRDVHKRENFLPAQLHSGAGSGEPAPDSHWATLWPKGIVGLTTVHGGVLDALRHGDLNGPCAAGPVRIRRPKLHRIDPSVPRTSPLGPQQDMVARLEGIWPRVPIAKQWGAGSSS